MHPDKNLIDRSGGPHFRAEGLGIDRPATPGPIRILYLPRLGRVGASGRYRCYQYLPYLREQGFDVDVAPLLDDEYLRKRYTTRSRSPIQAIPAYLRRLSWLLRGNRYHLIWLEKEALPWIPWRLESWFLQRATPYLVDYDDAQFHRYDDNASGLVRVLLGRKIDRVMRGAEIVVAGNTYIAARARLAGAARVELLPTVVDLQHYPLTPQPCNPIFTIGWIGTPINAHYLHSVYAALRQVCRDGAARLVAIGSGPIDLAGVPLEVRPWSEASEVQDLQQLDVGIMPLPDTPINRGKCGLKLIQYMACGRPVVGTPLGVNREIIDHGVTGFHADSTEQWVEALTRLRADANLRQRMGQAGRKKAEAQYSLTVAAPQLAHMLREAAHATDRARRKAA